MFKQHNRRNKVRISDWEMVSSLLLLRCNTYADT